MNHLGRTMDRMFSKSLDFGCTIWFMLQGTKQTLLFMSPELWGVCTSREGECRWLPSWRAGGWRWRDVVFDSWLAKHLPLWYVEHQQNRYLRLPNVLLSMKLSFFCPWIPGIWFYWLLHMIFQDAMASSQIYDRLQSGPDLLASIKSLRRMRYFFKSVFPLPHVHCKKLFPWSFHSLSSYRAGLWMASVLCHAKVPSTTPFHFNLEALVTGLWKSFLLPSRLAISHKVLVWVGFPTIPSVAHH